ncbi:FecR family protein [Roseospirillum parvum]|uniref:FecR protein n=1 Tax=Roseospirillum parvum TaxID=83401 RepID=A0A1G7WDY1_9PROT|nr:FecR family protein [Roseospirillum parvum]SDG70146.1 FecR protein [Roseospirillum parvum]
MIHLPFGITQAPAVALLGGLLLVAGPASAQSPGTEVGTSVLSVNQVEQVTRRGSAALPEGARVLFEALVRTGADSANKNLLEDGTELTLGPGAEVRVDSFVYDPASNAGEAALTLVSGAMRWASGSMASESYKILTPNASIGIRGTGLVIAVTAQQETVAVVETGAVSVTGSSQRSVDVAPGQFTVVDVAGVPSEPRDAAGTPAAAVVGALNTALATLSPPSVTLAPTTFSSLASRAGTARGEASITTATAAPESFGGDGTASHGDPPGGVSGGVGRGSGGDGSGGGDGGGGGGGHH